MDNRELILEAALELFTARGYEGCGIQEICERAGITKPTLYHYFGSKLGLLEALMDAHHAALAMAVDLAARPAHDLPLELERTMRAFFDFARVQPRYYRLLLGLYFAPPQSEAHAAMIRRFSAQQKTIGTLFLAAEADHGNMRGRSQFLAAAFLGLIHTCVGLALNGFACLDDQLLRQALRHFQYGIYS